MKRLNSVEEISGYSWQEFEDFVLELFNNIFRNNQELIHFHQIAKGPDGSKDATARVSMSSPESLPVAFKIWVEAKFRSVEQVDFSDLKDTLYHANTEGIDRLLIVTNNDFTESVKRDIYQGNETKELPTLLINGKNLFELSNGRDANSQPITVKVDGGLTANREYKETVNQGILSLDTNDLPFLVLVVKVMSEVQVPLVFELEAKYLEEGHIRIDILLDKHTPFRYVCPILSDNDEISISKDTNITVTSDFAKLNRNIQCFGKIEYRDTFLKESVIPSHKHSLEILHKRKKEWLMNGTSKVIHIKALPGVGKSFQLTRLRKDILKANTSILFLSGNTTSTSDDFFSKLVDFVSPIRNLERFQGALTEVLEDIGFDDAEIKKLVDFFKKDRIKGSTTITSNHVGVLVALTLKFAEKRKFAIIIDDYQKFHPTAKLLIYQLIRLLHSSRVKNYFIVLSSRINSMLDRDEAFIEQNKHVIEELILKTPTTTDALKMLRGSVKGLDQKTAADSILAQVPTTPYAIKEAIAFLHQQKILRRVSKDGEFRLIDPAGLRQKIDSKALVDPTAERYAEIIKEYAHKSKEWVDELLLCAALLGKSFDFSTVTKTLGIESGVDDSLLIDLINLDILKVNNEATDFEFSHDLIRDVVLRHNLPLRRMKVKKLAKKLLTFIGEADNIKTGILRAIEGDQHQAIQSFTAHAAKSHEAGLFLDSAFADLMCVQLIDPTIISGIQDNTKFWNLTYLDSAFKIFGAQQDTLSKTNGSEILKYLLDAVDKFSNSGLGKKLGLDYLISELQILAMQVDNSEAAAKVDFFQGKMFMESEDRFYESLKFHKLAQSRLEKAGSDNQKLISDNIARKFLCERQLDLVDNAKQSLSLFEEVSAPTVLNQAKVLTYKGYLKLYYDLKECNKYWMDAFNLVKNEGITDRIIHYGIGTAYSSLLLNDLETCGKQLIEVESNMDKTQKVSNQVRFMLNKANYCLLTNSPTESLTTISEGERLALQFGVFRRLWRVEATRATCEEYLGNKDTCYDYDTRAIRNLASRIYAERHQGLNAPWLKQRHVLPVMNMMLRGHKDLLSFIPEDQFKFIDSMVNMVERGNLKSLPNQLGYHIKNIGDNQFRAILTE